MAIRINLLPAYVGLERWFKRILAACVLLVGVFAIVLYMFYHRDQLRLQTLETNRANIEPIAQKTEAAERAKAAAEAEAKPMQDAITFLVDAGRTGAERAALLDLFHRYIYAGSVVSSLDLSDGTNAKIKAMVRTPDDYARFLMTLRQGAVPDGVLFEGLPTAQGIAGWPTKTQADGSPEATPVSDTEQQTDSGQSAPVDVLRYETFPNSVQAEGKLSAPIVIPQPGGTSAAAPTLEGAPGEDMD